MSNLLKFLPMIAMTLVVAVVAMFPEMALAAGAADKVAAAGEKSYDLVYSFVYWACAIAVVVCGVATAMGRMELNRLGQVAIGITIVFSGTAIVDYFK
ncbi:MULTISPECIES: TrbC/VirB2 family protein [Xanthomonas]|uniref:TrbC/VirB2 family protein n=1 Tax=Xanthomonas TaxID=338 RepID=UPI001C46042E|nr:MULTISPECIES: TrbC/VirB2 family protein [Xanthomonas]MBV6855869.1 TrbC/VirB2 family protein [Xanthomonas campestris pv. mirabilis]MEA9776961.1 TrbC/VirB2 family protein [Xanthomonas campestris pv. raphani]